MSTTTFYDAMASEGLRCDEIIADGQIHRFHVENDKRGTHNGWYIRFNSGIDAGVFGSWKNGLTHTWSAKTELTESERKQQKQKIKEAKALREQEQKKSRAKASERAKKIWTKSTSVSEQTYLNKKQINAYGIKQYGSVLVIPVRNTGGNICSLQFIDGGGNKRFLRDGAVSGNYHTIGKPTDTLYLSEGYATAATIHEVTQCGVIVAFDVGNLKPVAKALKKKYPGHKFVIAADNDQWTDGNPGITKAQLAASAIGDRKSVV